MRIDKNLIPWAGDRSVRRRLEELDERFTGLLVLIGIGFSKMFEGLVTIAIDEFPIGIWGVEISSFVWWTIYTGLLVLLFLSESDKKVQEKAEEVKESLEGNDG